MWWWFGGNCREKRDNWENEYDIEYVGDSGRGGSNDYSEGCWEKLFFRCSEICYHALEFVGGIT